jgi:hypothetical protein
MDGYIEDSHRIDSTPLSCKAWSGSLCRGEEIIVSSHMVQCRWMPQHRCLVKQQSSPLSSSSKDNKPSSCSTTVSSHGTKWPESRYDLVGAAARLLDTFACLVLASPSSCEDKNLLVAVAVFVLEKKTFVLFHDRILTRD